MAFRAGRSRQKRYSISYIRMNYFIYCRKSQEAEDRQVLSLESQTDEVQRLMTSDSSINVVGTFTEAYSAKSPGRPIFNDMVRRIENGEAEGIIAWHPDRLARNSMDGGQIIYLLDQGKLKDMRFSNYTFENSSNGKFMLSIMFGQSKYYVDNLSENVKRGQRTKLKNGWHPGRPPLGYKTCPDTGAIVHDPEQLKAIRQIYDWYLSGDTCAADIHRRLRDEMAYVTPQKKKTGGRSLSRTQVYRILCNPFYAGYVLWNGNMTAGAHEPVISRSEYQKVRRLLGMSTDTRMRTHSHRFRGLFTCGACGKAVTAERKTKPSGRQYTYYHCTRVHTTERCTQPSVEEKPLTAGIEAFLKSIRPPRAAVRLAAKVCDLPKVRTKAKDAERTLRQQRGSLDRQLSNLTDLRLREVVSDDEFNKKRLELRIARDLLDENLIKATKPQFTFEPLAMFTILFDRATFLFQTADQAGQRKLLQILCSNPTLKDKKPRFCLAFP